MSFSQAITQLFEFSRLGAYLAEKLSVEESDIMSALSSFEFKAEESNTTGKSVKPVPKKTATPAKSTKTETPAKAVKKPAPKEEESEDDSESEEATSKPAPKAKPTVKTTPAKSTESAKAKTTKTTKEVKIKEPAKGKTVEKNLCSHLLTKGRPGEECGKTASNEYDGSWYCGQHYKMVAGSPAKETKSAPKKTTTKTTATKKPVQSPQENKSVLDTMESRELSISKNKFGNFWDAQSHIVLRKLDEDDWEVIGQQDTTTKEKGEKSVIRLNKEQLGMCQAWNLNITEDAMPEEDSSEANEEEAQEETPLDDTDEVEEEEPVEVEEDVE